MFSNAVRNLRIPDFSETEPLTDNISHPTLKATMKYMNNSTITAIEHEISGKTIEFSRASEKDIFKEIKKLGKKKAVQSTNIAMKIIKENVDIFWRYL